MCGRFTSTTPVDDIATALDVDEVVAEDAGRRYNVAPTQDVYAVAEVGGRRRLGTLRWGLVPSWADDPRVGSRMINARSETVGEKPAFRSLLRRRRCIVPADGFYEWRRPGPEGPRQAFHIRRSDAGLLAFAALWDTWRPTGDPDGSMLTTCTILTTAAATGLAEVHHRMPVVLEGPARDRWLDRANGNARALRELLRPFDGLEVVAVGDAVNDVRNDGPHLVRPVFPGDGGSAGPSRATSYTSPP